VTTKFTTTRGFSAVGEPTVAVCLLPGTEVAFGKEVEYINILGVLPHRKLGQKVAVFRKIREGDPHAHHDALEFPDGHIVLLTRVCEGQLATVLQLPAVPFPAGEPEQPHKVSAA
jgi:hypothetical protein